MAETQAVPEAQTASAVVEETSAPVQKAEEPKPDLPQAKAESGKSLWQSFTTYGGLYVWAVIFGLITTLVLFLRPTPYGMAYVMDLAHYLPHAIFYMLYGLGVICFPFMIIALLRRRATTAGTTICAILLMLSLFWGHVDNEVLRYCKIHITVDFLETYVLSNGKPDAIWALLEGDQGGKNLSLYFLGLAPLFLITWLVFIRRLVRRIPQVPKHCKKLVWGVTGALVISFIFLPALFRSNLFGSKNRQLLVAPPFVLVKQGIDEYVAAKIEHADLATLIPRFQKDWSEAETDKNWQFIDTSRPFMKTYKGTCPNTSEPPWNIIVISIESFRARNLPLFYRDAKDDPTPYISSLASGGRAAYYTNYYTNGHPTIASFMAQHTSLLPHNAYTVAQRFTLDTLDSYVSSLRNHGYQTVFFGGSDPDWDNQRVWLNRWYDKIYYTPDYDEKDRLVMQDASRWLNEELDPSKPFLMTFFLITNHTPFTLPAEEENLRLTDSNEQKIKIINTMHYDDDVVREFIESIKDKPWFDHTIVMITGDHGMDLGDRGDSPDYDNLRHEATQVPLIVYSPKHPRIPVGKQEVIGSHLDLAPTILDLAHICDDNSFMGHSLLSVDPQKAHAIVIKHLRYAMDTNDYSVYMPSKKQIMMFDHEDYGQTTDISKQNKQTANDLKEYLLSISSLVNDAYRKDLYH